MSRDQILDLAEEAERSPNQKALSLWLYAVAGDVSPSGFSATFPGDCEQAASDEAEYETPQMVGTRFSELCLKGIALSEARKEAACSTANS